MNFNSYNATQLEVLPKNISFNSKITLSDGRFVDTKNAFCALISFEIKPNQEYTLTYEACTESMAYTYDAQSVVKDGITMLSPRNTQANNPYIERYHFTPPTGWLNDPNGLCFFGGSYHLYYQFYPHAQSWGNMHWGHAISENLVNWRHMPVFLTPQQALVENSALAGGAFSGSAIVDNDELRFFLTRHTAYLADESTMCETQATLTSYNSVKPQNETDIIKNTNEIHSYHFRDPKVFKHNDNNYLVLGSAINKNACILLYSSKDYINWSYIGPVLQIQNKDCVSVECPDMFKLSDKFVCIAAQMCVHDECKRISPVHYYIGSFDGKELVQEYSGIYDFGANFYAVQSFEHAGRRIAIGWIDDFYQEHIEQEGGVCGSMSLPRELFIQSNKLYMRPVKEVYSLLSDKVYDGNATTLCQDINGNAWYAQIIFSTNSSIDLVLARNDEDSISFESQNGKSKIVTTKAGLLQLASPTKTLARREIFADARTFEIFINDGEAAGAKTFYTSNMHSCFELKSAYGIENIKVFKMKTTLEDIL